MTAAVEFLREYFHGSKGNIFLGAVRNSGSKLGSGHIGELATRQPDAVAKFVATYDKPENECAIYYVTATLKNGTAKRPEAADCLQFVSAFADIDDANHELDRATVIERLEALPCPPTYVVDSGHGLQPVWLFDKPTEDAERVIAARKKLHAILASDSVHDAPRYMRLPGSHNSKRGGWKPVTVVSNHIGLRYTIEAIEAWLGAAQVVISRKSKPKNGAAGKPFVAPPSGKGTDPKRGAAWARVALEESARELAGVAEAGHNTLLAKAVRMGTMVARGWIDTLEVHRVLLAAAEACGLIKARGRPHFEATFSDGIKHGLTMPHADLPDDGPQPQSGPETGPELDDDEEPRRSEAGVSLEKFRAYMPMHNYIYEPTGEFWPASSVNSKLPPMPLLNDKGEPVVDDKGNPKTIAPNAWLDRNRSVEQLTWAPGEPRLITNRVISEGGWIEQAGVTCYNQYRPPNIKHGEPAAAGCWVEHVHKVYGGDADHIIRWLAHRVQRPEDKINHALVLGGAQGIGKDTLLAPVNQAVGPWNVAEVSPQQMLGRFNGFTKSVIARVSEARDLGDVDRFKFYDHMKVYTAAPPDMLRVDEKHLREHNVLNCVGIIITTNYKTDGIYLPGRRSPAFRCLERSAF